MTDSDKLKYLVANLSRRYYYHKKQEGVHHRQEADQIEMMFMNCHVDMDDEIIRTNKGMAPKINKGLLGDRGNE